MSKQVVTKRKTIRDIAAFKSADKAMVCLTAYTAPVAVLADKYADLILVGDSLGNVIYGFDSTLPVTMEMMTAHGRAVVNTTHSALVAVDMPFGSYQESPEQAFRNAARLMADTGCQAVKFEGGVEMAATVAFLVQRGVPVIGHVGLQPQSVHGSGGYRVVGRETEERQKILADAKAIAESGAFAIVLEGMNATLAEIVTAQVAVPTIGIGAGAGCDGQILVCDDVLGLGIGTPPKFVKSYAEIGKIIDEAFARYAAEVQARSFPDEAYTYKDSAQKKMRAVD